MVASARVPDDLRGEVRPGVVFCLRQNDETRDPKDTNPLFPYYVAYVAEDGTVASGHTQPKMALDLMRAACAGVAEPDPTLCDLFKRQTNDGLDMSAYTGLLEKMIEGITGVQEAKGLESLFTLGEVGAAAPSSFDDYSLVSFVVLR